MRPFVGPPWFERLRVSRRPAAIRYAVAIGAVIVSAACRMLLDPYLGEQAPFGLFQPAVMVAAWYGGIGPATLAVLLSFFTADYLFVAPRGAFTFANPASGFVTRAIVFMTVSEFLAIFAASLAATRRVSDATSDYLRTLIECVPVGVFQTDLSGRCVFVNDRWTRYAGLSLAEAAGEGWRAAIHPDDRDRVFAAWEETLGRSSELDLEYRYLTPDGRVTWVNGRTTTLTEAGRPIGYLGSVTDVTARKSAESALGASEARARRLVDSNIIGVVFANKDGDVTGANQAFLDMLGFGRAELEAGAVRWTAMTPPEFTHVDAVGLREADERGACRPYEKVFVARDGRRVPVLVGFALLEDSRSDYVAFVLDLRRLKETEAALREADERKDQFLAMLAHELRNPLVPIRNAVELLRTFGSDEARERAVRDMIERQVAHMARLIDDLLDVSRITSGKIRLRKEPVLVADVIRHAVEAAGPLIEQRGHTLTISESPERLRVDGDAGRLVQVVANLLSNAAKYTESGGHVTVSTEAGDGAVTIRVRDTGVGIERGLLPRIFDLFVQGEGTIDRHQGGLGVGLTMVKTLVELHGGRVEARSDGSGRGTEFMVTLPALAPSLELPQRHGSNATGAVRRSLRILIAEDNRDAAESYRMLLEIAGHEVRVAHTGPAALEAADEFAADVALIDIGLPGVDGCAVARRLRELPAYKGTLLVAISGYGRPEDKEAARRAGFDHHVTKPVERDVFQALLASIADAGITTAADEESVRALH